MKNIITILAMLLIGFTVPAAQSVTIINSTSCTYSVWLSAHIGTNQCGSMVSNTIGVAPGATIVFTNPAQFESSIGWTCGKSIGAGFLWDYARINSGFNMVGICSCFTVTSRSIVICSTTVHITYESYGFGNVTITIAP